ncbi:MAG: M48 family metallopeptidase [Phycisphaerae bacterium]
MQIVILLAFVATYATLELPAPSWVGGWLTLPLIVAYLAGTASITSAWTAAGLRHLEKFGPTDGKRPLGQAALQALRLLWLVGGSVAVAYLGYARWLMQDAHLPGLGHAWPLGRWPLLGELALLVPFVLALVLTWRLEYPYHRQVRARVAEAAPSEAPPFWTARQFLIFNLRHHLLFILAPVSLIVLGGDLIDLAYRAGWFGAGLTGEILSGVATIAVVGSVFLCAPLLIVRVWKTRPLERGPLRDRLEEMCRRLRLRCRNVLVWESGGVLANAGAMGVIGPVRYVLLSDALLERMPPEQIEAIFAHEAGHIVGHHIFFSGLFAIGSITLVQAAVESLAIPLQLDATTALASAVAVLATVWALGFGWISRRFERQSDVLAAWVMSRQLAPDPDMVGDRVTPQGARVFADALEQVAILNGMSFRKFNWRHGSIAWRVNHILNLGARGGTVRQIARVVTAIKLLLLTAAAGGITWMVILYQSTPEGI